MEALGGWEGANLTHGDTHSTPESVRDSVCVCLIIEKATPQATSFLASLTVTVPGMFRA